MEVKLALSYVGSVTARHSSSGRELNCGMVSSLGSRAFKRLNDNESFKRLRN